MQISLRSQMIAGTTAIVGATAIAMTPVAPAVSIPSISMSKAAVALAAFPVNPVQTIVQSGALAVNYLLNPNYSRAIPGGGLANWGQGYATGALGNNIGDILNEALYSNVLGPQITSVGVIPNFLAAPFPILTQLTNNWVGYATVAAVTVGAVLTAGANILWSPVGLVISVVNDLLTGNIAAIPGEFVNTLNYIVGQFTNAGTAVYTGVQTIVSSIITKGYAVVQSLAGTLPNLIGAVTNVFTAIGNTGMAVLNQITTALASGNLVNAWNAAVEGLLGPTGIAGSLINLTIGAGQQIGPNPLTQFAPSVRTELQGLGQTVTAALKTPPPSASVSPAAAVEAAPVEAAPAADAAPSASAVRSDAAEVSAAAPAAAASESAAPADDSPAPSKGKAAARSGGRG